MIQSSVQKLIASGGRSIRRADASLLQFSQTHHGCISTEWSSLSQPISAQQKVTFTSCSSRCPPTMMGPPHALHDKSHQNQLSHPPFRPSTTQLCLPLNSPSLTHQRQLSSKSRKGNRNKKKVDDNAPLLNEHLIAELFNKKKRDNQNVTAETYEVRLIIDQGRSKKTNNNNDDDNDDDDDGDPEETNDTNVPTSQITTLHEAISIAHDLSLDLIEVTLRGNPPVIKAVNFDRWLYEQKRKERLAASKKKKEGGGAISDRPLKEFKFRAGIADHDLARKTKNMISYLEKGHAIRVTLTARQRMLNSDEMAISTTFERVKELVGDRAVEVRAMKANERKSYGSLLLHPNKGGKA